MSSRSLAAVSLSLAFALVLAPTAACGRRESSGAGAGPGTGATTTAHDAATPSLAPAPLALAAIDASLADGTLQLVGIDVLTAPTLFKTRASGAGPKPMEPLVAAARAAVTAVDAARAGELGDAVVVWIAVRPGRKVRAWVACPGKPDADAARADVIARMTLAAGPEVTGPVAFAVAFDRSGARRPGNEIPIPPELEAVRGQAGAAATPETLIERGWTP